jgi:hypothetical protein
MATPTMPSGSSIRRLAKYSHDTAEGDDDAMMAPPTTSNCGPPFAIMPGIALPRKPRMSASKAMRSGVATLPPPRRNSRINSCNSPAMPTVAAMIVAAWAASCRQPSSAVITDISATLNNSGENAVSANRCCALISAIITVAGPAKAR